MSSDAWVTRATLLPQGDWNRRLHGPWRMLTMSVNSGALHQTDPTSYIEAVVSAMFNVEPFPPRAVRQVIVDDDSWIALGFSTDPQYISNVGHDCWMGSEIGFSVLESLNIIDPLTLALWESWARETSDVEDWWT